MASSNTFPHVIQAIDIADMASIHVSELDYGTICFVVSANADFTLTPTPSTPPDGVTVVAPVPQAAVGKPGAAWEKGGGGGGGGSLFIDGTTLAALAVTIGNDSNALVYVFDTHAFYRWSPAGAATPDGWTVVTAPGGQWLLQGDTLALNPIGAPFDDGARISLAVNAVAAKGGTVALLPGTYLIQTAIEIVSPVGVELTAPQGGVILQGAIPPGGTIIGADSWNSRVPQTTLAAPVVQGQPTLQVTAIGAIAIGSEIALFSVAQGGACYTVTNVVGTTVTVERPVLRPYAAGTEVSTMAPGKPFPKNVHVSGMVFTGTAGTCVEFIGGATNCSVEDCTSNGNWTNWVFNFDYGSLRSTFSRLSQGVSDTTIGWWVGFEGAEDCEAYACHGVASGFPIGFWVNTSVNVNHDDCSYGGATVGIEYGSNDPGGTGTGCISCTVTGSDFTDSASSGVAILDGATDIRVVDTAANRCPTGVILGVNLTTTPPTACVVQNLEAKNCSTASVSVNGGNGHHILNVTATGSAAAAKAGTPFAMEGLILENIIGDDCTGAAIIVISNGAGLGTRHTRILNPNIARAPAIAIQVDAGVVDTDIDGGYFLDCSRITAGGQVLKLAGLTRVLNTDFEYSVDPGIGLSIVYTNVANTDVTVRGVRFLVPKVASPFFLYLVSEAAGTIFRVSDVQTIDKGGVGAGTRTFYFADTGTSFFIRGEDVDSRGCDATYNLAAGSQLNVGTFPVNGATPVPVAWGLTGTNTKVTVIRSVAGGAAGPSPAYARTPGTGVTFTGTAGDTSTYEYNFDGS